MESRPTRNGMGSQEVVYNVHLPIMLESERQAVYRERKKERVGSEIPFPAELPNADLHSLFLQIHPRWRFFINNFYLKSPHRLKSISGTIITIENNNDFNFNAILLLGGGLKATAECINRAIVSFWKVVRPLNAVDVHRVPKAQVVGRAPEGVRPPFVWEVWRISPMKIL